MVGDRRNLNGEITREKHEMGNEPGTATYLSWGRLFSLDIFFGRVLNGDKVQERKISQVQTRRTGAGVSTFVSGEGSTAGVTSVGLSSVGTAAAAAVGSDIMLWDTGLVTGRTRTVKRETYTYGY